MLTKLKNEDRAPRYSGQESISSHLARKQNHNLHYQIIYLGLTIQHPPMLQPSKNNGRVVYPKHNVKQDSPLQTSNSNGQQFRIYIINETTLITTCSFNVIIGERISLAICIRCMDNLVGCQRNRASNSTRPIQSRCRQIFGNFFL